MKKSKIRKIIQKPLRFHHQDIHDEIEGLTELILSVGNRLIRIEQSLKDLKNLQNQDDRVRLEGNPDND
jgi:hypothetical protein